MELIRLNELVVDLNFQIRNYTYKAETVKAYENMLRHGVLFPPIKIGRCSEGGEYYLLDGFHRTRAAKLAGRYSINCEIPPGCDGASYEFLMDWARQNSNREHGNPLTTAEKRKQFSEAYENNIEEYSKKSSRVLGAEWGVSHATIAKWIKSEGLDYKAKKWELRMAAQEMERPPLTPEEVTKWIEFNHYLLDDEQVVRIKLTLNSR